ncbi:50S ribosomal protein L21 [Candidatus Uhrbacteria bacterium]|nr:50S ribosomal protein L21 [Candidatus Uhrbacteria bacterium]
MIAVIKTGGKQYKVREGAVLAIEKVATQPGESLDLEVLFVADEEGTGVKIGTPTVTGAKVVARVLEHGRAEKVSVVKYKPKVRYKKNVGHRQPFTKIKIEKIDK